MTITSQYIAGGFGMKISAEWISVVMVILVPMISGIVAQLRLLWSVAEKVDGITSNYRTVLAEIEQIKRRLEELEEELRR
jgi:hypothetical protein